MKELHKNPYDAIAITVCITTITLVFLIVIFANNFSNKIPYIVLFNTLIVIMLGYFESKRKHK